MAVMTINKKTFEKEIGRLDKNMQEKIAMFGTPIDKISEEEIDIEIFPNRPDLLSFHGYKRSFLDFLGKKSKKTEYKVNKPEKNFQVIIDSSVKDIRPYTACAIVKDLSLDNEKIKELIDIQEKLHSTLGRNRKKLAIGIYPLEKIALPITFKALDPEKIKFTPLEAEREMSGLEILQKHPKGKEFSHLLAGKAKFPIFEDALGNILSMPPIINSILTGKITEKTKDVFIECSGFDLESLKRCLNIIVVCLADMQGKIYQMDLKYSKKEITPDLSPKKTRLNIDYANKILGLDLKESQIKSLLEKMGHEYKNKMVESPGWRTDILHEIDLVEDLAIAYGYDKFVPEIPSISTIGEINREENIKEKIADVLTGSGIQEVSNYHLTTKKDQFMNQGTQEKQAKNFIELEKSKTEFGILRQDLSHYLLKNLSENVDAEYPQAIFELGKVFEDNKEIIEKEKLAIAITPGNFTELRQILEYLFKMLGLKIKISEPENSPLHFIEGRVGEIVLANDISENGGGGRGDGGGNIKETSLGFIGEIHPKILSNWKLKMPATILEISLEEIFKRLD
jgi:phenylalanyl-tRNA synthetase beta chain